MCFAVGVRRSRPVVVTKRLLEVFYKKHDSSKLKNIDNILAKHASDEIVALLTERYGESPLPPEISLQQAPATKQPVQREASTTSAPNMQ